MERRQHFRPRSSLQRSPWIQFRTPANFAWSRFDLPVPSLPPALEGLRIVHLSDFHLRTHWARAYDELIDLLHQDAADLLLVTGDFVEDKRNPRPALPNLRRLVRGLTARLGCWGILGNHDRYHLAPYLHGSNVTLLDGRRQLLGYRGATIELIGLPGVDRFDLSEEFVQSIPPREAASLRVVLSHFPDHIRRTSALRADLFLAGHTHGGQVCLPFAGGFPILRHDSLPRRLCKGAHRVDDTWLVVNRGFGFSGPPVRLFCSCEVIEIRLRAGEVESQ